MNEAQDKMIYITHLLPYFNANFNYVNENGKRTGIKLFPNAELTHKLEQLAVTLRGQVQALVDNRNIEDTAKAQKFIELINSTYATVLGYRKDYAKKASKFEEQLVLGLNGIINEYTNIFPTFDNESNSSQANAKPVGLVGNMITYKEFKDNCEKLIVMIDPSKNVRDLNSRTPAPFNN